MTTTKTLQPGPVDPLKGRRDLLKSIAAAGVLAPVMASVGAPAMAAAATGNRPRQGPANDGTLLRRALPVTTGHEGLDAAFVQGVTAAARRSATFMLPTQIIGELDPKALAALRRVAAGQPTIVVGLTDTATAMLVLDQVRSASGGVLAMTHHRLANEADSAVWASGIGEQAFNHAFRPPVLLAGSADDGAAGAFHLAGGVACVSFTCTL